MDIAIKVLQFILSFSLLVVIHEMGHFMFSRMFGVRVEKFYMFFNPWFSLFKFKHKDTEYGIGWIPLGGYVKIAGMIDESMDVEQLNQPVKDDEFRAKPAWQRLLIMVGGVLMNIVLAICIYIGMSYAFGDKYLSNEDVTYGYSFNDTALKMGFENGDQIVSVGGKSIDNMTDIYKTILLEGSTTVSVLRGSEAVDINIDGSYTSELLEQKTPFLEPRSKFVLDGVLEESGASRAGLAKGDRVVAVNGEAMSFTDNISKVIRENAEGSVELSVLRDSEGDESSFDVAVDVSDQGVIGVSLVPFVSQMPIHTTAYSLLESIPAGFRRTGSELSAYWKQIKMIVSPETKAYKSLGGMIAIGNIFPSYWSWESFWSITAFLSVVLAVMNILPIPALDGGHVLFLVYEIIARKAPSQKFMEVAQTVGLVILFALLIYANGNDIYRFFIK